MPVNVAPDGCHDLSFDEDLGGPESPLRLCPDCRSLPLDLLLSNPEPSSVPDVLDDHFQPSFGTFDNLPNGEDVISEDSSQSESGVPSADNSEPFASPLPHLETSDLRPDFISPRTFNTVTVVDTKSVRKSSRCRSILGELFFYTHYPATLASLFPHLHNIDLSVAHTLDGVPMDHGLRVVVHQAIRCQTFVNGKRNDEVSLTLARVHGPTYTHLITSLTLTPAHLLRLLDSLRAVHNSSPLPHVQPCACRIGPVNIYSNYSQKLRHRQASFPEVYKAMGHILTAENFDRITELLDEYEIEHRGIHAQIIHGDPVFSNVLLPQNGYPQFIDMRGMQGDQFTTEGDVAYDLAKCLQSLTGYDMVIQGAPITGPYRLLLRALQVEFSKFVRRFYPRILLRDLVLITASLYASMLPLHETPSHLSVFAQSAVALLELVNRSRARGDDDMCIPFVDSAARTK